MIAYSRAENLRDLLVKAKLAHPEEEDHTYEDFMRYEDTPPTSPILHQLQELETESRGFNKFVFLEDSDTESTNT